MKIKYKKELKISSDLEVGDNLRVGGLLCEILKVDDVFYHAPKTQIRLELRVEGATARTQNAILFLPRGVPVTILK